MQVKAILMSKDKSLLLVLKETRVYLFDALQIAWVVLDHKDIDLCSWFEVGKDDIWDEPSMSELELTGGHWVIFPDYQIWDDNILLFFVVVRLKGALVVVFALYLASEDFSSVLVS